MENAATWSPTCRYRVYATTRTSTVFLWKKSPRETGRDGRGHVILDTFVKYDVHIPILTATLHQLIAQYNYHTCVNRILRNSTENASSVAEVPAVLKGYRKTVPNPTIISWYSIFDHDAYNLFSSGTPVHPINKIRTDRNKIPYDIGMLFPRAGPVFAQSTVHTALCPISALNKVQHRAGEDTKAMWEIIEAVMSMEISIQYRPFKYVSRIFSRPRAASNGSSNWFCRKPSLSCCRLVVEVRCE